MVARPEINTQRHVTWSKAKRGHGVHACQAAGKELQLKRLRSCASHVGAGNESAPKFSSRTRVKKRGEISRFHGV